MKKSIVITLYQENLDNIKTFSEKLTGEGLEVTNVFEFGVITGLTEENNIEKIEKLPEVESVTIEKIVQLPSPDDDIQ